MGLPHAPRHLLRPRLLASLLLPALASLWLPAAAQAGPLVRRAQERRACQEFAGKLIQASGNPAMAQQVYQQGVLQLVSRFGENPCTDIAAPTATGSTPAATTPPTAKPTTAPTSAPATTAAPAAPTASPATTSGAAAGSNSNAPASTAAPSDQQQQACQQFAGKLQAAAASGGAAAAQQTYAMGLQKLTGMFGSTPCPGVRPPQ